LEHPLPALSALLRPASVAVVGARDDTTTYGGRVWTYLTRTYAGTATAVNARTDAVRSRPCVATLAEVTPAPEAVVLATPAHTVVSLLEQAGAMGSKAAIVFSRDLLGHEEEIRSVGAKYGMNVLGPNCLGLINPNAGVILSSSISLERPSRPGPLAFVSQSGALMGVLHARAIDLGLGLGLCVSTGSQAMVRVEDVLLELAANDDIRAVGAYLEDLDVPLFIAAATALREHGIRLVALKSGSTPAGSETASAHSRALASNGHAFASLADDLGVMLTDDPGELLTTLAVASTAGPRWHIVTPSGGIAAIAADQATTLGLELPQPTQQTCDIVQRNPADLDAAPSTTRQKVDAIAALAGDPRLDGVLVIMNDMPDADDFMRELAVVAGHEPSRVLVVSECSQQLAPLWHDWVDGGATFLPGLAPTLRALARVHGRQPSRHAAAGVPSPLLIPPGDVQALLAATDIPVLPVREVDSADAACAAADSLGYPVVLKVSRLLHRGVQGIRLGVADSLGVAAAYRELAQQGPVLVQAQSAPGLEFYVGVRADPVFGSLLLVGAGGPAVGELADVVIGRPPLEPERIRALVASTAVGRWLASPASGGLYDIESLVPIAVAAIQVMAEAPQLESLDLNPVVVHHSGATVVDAKASRAHRPSALPSITGHCPDEYLRSEETGFMTEQVLQVDERMVRA
jgi:acyl-CoA synthetase (NDP forming)